MSTVVTWWLGREPSPREFRDLLVAPFNASQDGIRREARISSGAVAAGL